MWPGESTAGGAGSGTRQLAVENQVDCDQMKTATPERINPQSRFIK
jgi:hypothetical protein